MFENPPKIDEKNEALALCLAASGLPVTISFTKLSVFYPGRFYSLKFSTVNAFKILLKSFLTGKI